MRKVTILAAAVSAVIAVPAAAQDTDASGLYVVAVAGFDSLDIGGNEEDIAYGISAGYDYGLGSAFVGVEVEGTLSGVGASEEDVLVVGDEISVGAGRDLYVGLRAGTMIGEGAKVYVKGGYTNIAIDGEYDDNAGVSVDESDEIDGYRVGAGLELMLGERAVIRGEYRYSDYGNPTLFGSPLGVNVERHQVLAGVGITF